MGIKANRMQAYDARSKLIRETSVDSTVARRGKRDQEDSTSRGFQMKISVGFELVYDCPQPTPMILTLSIHYSRVSDLLKPDHLIINPPVPIKAYRDGFGNWCSRIVAPKGEVRLRADSIVSDPGTTDRVDRSAQQQAINDLPEDTLVYLLGSRYCETDRLSETAWALFGNAPTGWGRVQAICDFVHNHITFGYEHARSTRTAMEAFQE